MLVHFEHIGRYDIIPAIAILSREIMVSGLREFLAKLNVSVQVTNLAKVKTAIQMIAIFLLLLGVEGPTIIEVEEITETNLTEFLGKIMLWVSAVLTLITGYAYLKSGMKHITGSDAKE